MSLFISSAKSNAESLVENYSPNGIGEGTKAGPKNEYQVETQGPVRHGGALLTSVVLTGRSIVDGGDYIFDKFKYRSQPTIPKFPPSPNGLAFWAGTPALKLLPQVAKTSGIISLFFMMPWEVLEIYHAVSTDQRTLGDAVVDGTVDVGICFASATAGMLLGAKIGGAAGSVVPVLGNVVGIAAGGAIGFGVGYLLNLGKEYALS